MVGSVLLATLRQHGTRPADLFNACDADRDGLISSEDFAAGLRQLGLPVDDPEETFDRLIDGGVAPLNYCDFSRRLRLIAREVPEAPPEEPLPTEAARAHAPSNPRALQEKKKSQRFCTRPLPPSATSKMQSLQATMQEARDQVAQPQTDVPMLEATAPTAALENLMLQAEEQARRLQVQEDAAMEAAVEEAAVKTAVEAAVEAVVALDAPPASTSTAARATTSRLEQRAEGLRQLMCAPPPRDLPRSPCAQPLRVHSPPMCTAPMCRPSMCPPMRVPAPASAVWAHSPRGCAGSRRGHSLRRRLHPRAVPCVHLPTKRGRPRRPKRRWRGLPIKGACSRGWPCSRA